MPPRFRGIPIGNITGLINSSGTQVNTYTYDPYGNTTTTGSVANPYQYKAGYTDPTAYTKFGARYYYTQPSEHGPNKIPAGAVLDTVLPRTTP